MDQVCRLQDKASMPGRTMSYADWLLEASEEEQMRSELLKEASFEEEYKEMQYAKKTNALPTENKQSEQTHH